MFDVYFDSCQLAAVFLKAMKHYKCVAERTTCADTEWNTNGMKRSSCARMAQFPGVRRHESSQASRFGAVHTLPDTSFRFIQKR